MAVLLADVPWSAIARFRKAQSGRSAPEPNLHRADRTAPCGEGSGANCRTRTTYHADGEAETLPAARPRSERLPPTTTAAAPPRQARTLFQEGPAETGAMKAPAMAGSAAGCGSGSCQVGSTRAATSTASHRPGRRRAGQGGVGARHRDHYGSSRHGRTLKIFDKPAEFAAQVAKSAQFELGLEAQPPGMMRDYLERKVPLRDAFFAAHILESARKADNKLIEAWAARALVMLEQWAIDQGRSQLAWLLSALPDRTPPTCSRGGRTCGRTVAIEFLENRM